MIILFSIGMSQRIVLRGVWRCISPRFKQQFLLNSKRFIHPSFISHDQSDLRKTNRVSVPGASADLLMQNFRHANDASDILYNVQQHHSIMNEEHCLQALQTIFTFQKSQHPSMTNKELVNHDSFQLLCKVFHKKIKFLELNDHLSALKVLSYVGVKSTSKLTQVILQLVAKQVNLLSLQQVMFLDFILKDFEKSPLVDALHIALPIVFEAHFQLKKSSCDVKQLAELFIYAVRRRLSDQCIGSFIEIFNETKKDLDVDDCKLIVRALCDIKKTSLAYRNLLHQSLDTIVDNVKQVPFLEINSVLARLTTNYNRNSLHFYHEEFVNCCANYIIENKCDDEHATWVLRSCNKFKHHHPGIIDYVCERVTENPEGLEKWTIGMLLSLTDSLALCDYKPNCFESFKDTLIKCIIRHLNTIELPWMRTGLDFCTLDCWPVELFEKVFEEDFLRQNMKRGNHGDLVKMVQLYQAVRVLCPSYRGCFPSEPLIKKAISEISNYALENESPLLGALETGLSGSSYVCSPVITKLGQVIDHAVVMRKGGYPVAINLKENKTSRTLISVEDLLIPEDSQIILILYLTPESYTLNTEKIIGQVRLNIETLEAMGYSVIPVMHSVWQNLHDSEKIPYLMQAVKNKCLSVEDAAVSQA